MHHYTDKKKIIVFLILVIIFLTSINSQSFIAKKENFFNLKNIQIYGLDESLNKEIKKNLEYLKNSNIFFLDKEILIDQLQKYKFIDSYTVFKTYPSKIIIKITPTEFLAKTLKNNKFYLVGSNGKIINTKYYENYEQLPIIYGKFAKENFVYFKKILDQTSYNFKNFEEIYFFPSGRIDVKTKNNLQIKLPIKNIKKALIDAKKIINDGTIRNIIIDLRVSNQVILSNE